MGKTQIIEQNQRVAQAFAEQCEGLLKFVENQVEDRWDAEDIAQQVFCDLVRANRQCRQISHPDGWLLREARDRIWDLFWERRSRPTTVLPKQSPYADPEAYYRSGVLLEGLAEALAALPDEQRAVIVAHDLEGRSFKDLSNQCGVNSNTLLSRKRAAVLRLRERLRRVYDELE